MKATRTGFNPEYAEDAPSREEVVALAGAALLEFGAPWCGHCLAARGAVEAAMQAYPELPHIKVYDGRGKVLGRAFQVKLWPTLIVLRDGVEQARLVRPRQAGEVSAWLAAALGDSGKGSA